MVLRALLAIWFLTTSALGPVLCCCTPLAPWKAGHRARVAAAQPVTAPAHHACPHCKDKPAKPSTPTKQAPAESPSPACPGKCPCQNHALVPAVPDGEANALRALVQFNWFPAAPAFDSVFTAGLLPFEKGSVLRNHTGPPPLSGVERLHRLHVLVC